MREFNFDGLVGPTHNYAGLSFGNVASASHRLQTSHPRQAALQGLAKMQTLHSMGISQAILPPLPRPDLRLLHRLGFRGKSDASLIENAYKTSPQLVANCYSAANMWTANAATVSPSPDCEDGKLHLTPANLSSTLHRSLEPEPMTAILRFIFADGDHFVVHDPLDSIVALTDEGAANHTRICDQHGNPGIEIFVYGVDYLNSAIPRPLKFPARQTKLASETLARFHRLNSIRTFCWQQTPIAIDAGIFHNDVISVGNENVLLVHELAYMNQVQHLAELTECYSRHCAGKLHIVEFSQHQFPVADAVSSYFFNSQLVTRPDGGMSLICPSDCQQIPSAAAAIEHLLELPNPVDDVKYLDLRQSMNNGGGPACLRLRIAMTDLQASKIHQDIVLNRTRCEQLEDCIQSFYREDLLPEDLADPKLVEESQAATEAIYRILQLPVPAG